MFKKIVLMVCFLLLATQVVLAHDAWMEKRDGKLVVCYGHGAKLDPYDPQKVKDVKAIACKGAAAPVEVVKHKESASLVLKGNPAIVTLLFDNGYWVQSTDGWKNMPKREAQKKFTILSSSISRKYAKALLKPCDKPSQPLGLVLEIVPQKDPFTIKPGEVLPVKVLLNGKPLEGVVVRTGDSGHSSSKDQLKTDKEGKANVSIGKSGCQIILASHKTPLKDDPDADKLSLSASLTFELK